ncbi:MAG: ABC transporter ATP-binding protein/permease [Clostridium sp.]|nr:ABC transporter ATP-binding protein/permease [Clostridium sp.]
MTRKIKAFFRAISLSVKLKSPISFIVSILGFAAAFLPMLMSLRLADFTDKASALFGNPDILKTVMLSFAFLALLYIVQLLFGFVQNCCANEDSARINRYLKESMMRLLTEIPLEYIENHGDFREKMDFVRGHAAPKAAGSISIIFGWIYNIISFISVTFIISVVNPWITVLLIVTCIPAVILSMIQKDETYRSRTKWMKEGRLTLHYSDKCRTNDSMKEIRYFGLYPYLKAKWRSLIGNYVKKKNKVTRKHVIYNGIADLLRNGVYLAVVLLTALEIYNNPEKGLGTFMLVVSAAGQLQGITTTLLVNAVSIFSDLRYIEDFFDLMGTQKEIINDSSEFYTRAEIEFKDVDFVYPGSEYKALDKLNVSIKQGEKIAIVGANGSGKSTFVNLLCGLYKPQSGNATINGNEITQDLAKARRSLSVIFQNFCTYQDTLRNNIALSDPDRAMEDDELLKIARQTGADEVISEQDEGLDEMIGLFSEEGKNLSGGQWQKIAVTRALFRKNACVYILDEPTAALDPVAEANIYRNFKNLTGNKTTILISHRLGVTSIVDRILVFDNGRIAEDGNHSDLMGQNGIYARMYQAQAKWYI